MSAKSTAIKQLLINKVNNLDSTQSVYGYEELNPEGWPSVWITDGSMTGEFVTNTENRRVYAYAVTVMMDVAQDYPNQGNKDRDEFVRDALSDVVDDIIDAVDTDYELDGATVLFVDAADYERGKVILENGQAMAVNITLLVNTDKNIS